MSDQERHHLWLDVQRLSFIHDCRTKLSLIERGYIRDPEGSRRASLMVLIERHGGR